MLSPRDGGGGVLKARHREGLQRGVEARQREGAGDVAGALGAEGSLEVRHRERTGSAGRGRSAGGGMEGGGRARKKTLAPIHSGGGWGLLPGFVLHGLVPAFFVFRPPERDTASNP